MSRALTTDHLALNDISDRSADFVLAHRTKRIFATLRCGYEKKGDGIMWAMQRTGVLKASYTAEDRAHLDRMAVDTGIEDGEIVTIDGKRYRCRILGDYSNAAVFDPMGE